MTNDFEVTGPNLYLIYNNVFVQNRRFKRARIHRVRPVIFFELIRLQKELFSRFRSIMFATVNYVTGNDLQPCVCLLLDRE